MAGLLQYRGASLKNKEAVQNDRTFVPDASEEPSTVKDGRAVKAADVWANRRRRREDAAKKKNGIGRVGEGGRVERRRRTPDQDAGEQKNQ